MRVSIDISEEWVYPCFGRGKNGDVVWFAEKGIGHSVVGDARYSGPWDMTCFKPIDNSFKDKRFDSITIVLDTQEEAISMANAMYNEPTITMDEWALLKVLLD
jgi:hypothetical protein